MQHFLSKQFEKSFSKLSRGVKSKAIGQLTIFVVDHMDVRLNNHSLAGKRSNYRRLNITGYLDRLKELEQAQTNELLKMQTAGYRNFVESLVEGGSILAKNFFVVVPFTLSETLSGSGTNQNIFKTKPKVMGKLTDEEFDRMKTQLWQRMEFVALGLRRMGLHVAPLSSEELVELLWTWYHPEEAEVGYYPEVPPELLNQTKKI